MRRTMRAARFHGPGETLVIEEVPIPAPGPDEALIRVVAAGLCHTDLQFLAGTLSFGVTPLTLGHEVAGTVVEVGPRVRSLRPGARVCVYYYGTCGECHWCRTDRENLCPNVHAQYGFSADGGYAEYVRVPEQYLVAVPEAVSLDQAAVLACSGTTALHAARAIAELAPGETAVVFGVGAIGLALVQVARLLGARVLAIGRSPEKLEAARDLGADVALDARSQDVVGEVHRLTGGEGADVVFELVATAETMPEALRMLRRRGRLVFVGYSQDRLRINPLWLMLREIQIRASLGATRRELVDVLDLAAAGKLRAIISRAEPLEEISVLIAALRSGQLVGRGVVRPGEGGRPPHPIAGGSAEADLAAAKGEIAAVIARGIDGPRDDAEFNRLALRLFSCQFQLNEPYRRYCERRGRTPETVAHWNEVPGVPIGAFKQATFACGPTEHAEALFMTSGTTAPEQRGRHFHLTLDLYNLSATTNFAAHVLPDGARLRMLILNPPPEMVPHAALAYYLGLMQRRYGAEGSRFFIGPDGLDSAELVAALREAERSAEPVCLLGATFAYVHFLDFCQAEGLRFQLAAGSRIFDTGGVKGKSREVGKADLYADFAATFGVPEYACVNMYGMTESSTQFIDDTLRNHHRGIVSPRAKTVVPWARTLILDPETMAEARPGQTGLLQHVDLANYGSAMVLLTEDLGYAVDLGFELIGRARGAEARGCSIAIDELLSAMGRGA